MAQSSALCPGQESAPPLSSVVTRVVLSCHLLLSLLLGQRGPLPILLRAPAKKGDFPLVPPGAVPSDQDQLGAWTPAMGLPPSKVTGPEMPLMSRFPSVPPNSSSQALCSRSPSRWLFTPSTLALCLVACISSTKEEEFISHPLTLGLAL